MTEIQRVTGELRAIAIELNNKYISHFRKVRLMDKQWDLEARYEMLLRQAGLTKP